MALLDLQGLTPPSEAVYGKSGSSKNCGNIIGGNSGLSLLLCGGRK
jgi:Lanthionine-containing peptide SapB precursor RamS